MTRLGMFLAALLVVSGCGGGSEIAAPTTTAVPATTSTAAPTTTAVPATTSTAAPIKVEAPEFSSSNSHEEFSGALQTAFSQALTSEFEAIPLRMGISAAVHQGTTGRLWSQALGNAVASRSMTTATPLSVMSSSKTFLAALVLTQIENGLYSLDDHLPTLLAGDHDFQSLDPSTIPDATVEQYLAQRSGGGDGQSRTPAKYFMMVAPTWKPADLVRLLEPAGPAGPFRYANANAWLLGMLAEHMGQDHLHALYDRAFFQPLNVQAGLRPTIETPADMAHPYGDRSRWGGAAGSGWGDLTEIEIFAQVDSIEADGRSAWAGAGITSTAENMARWAYELYSPSGLAVSTSIRQQIVESVYDEIVDCCPQPVRYGYMTAFQSFTLSDGTVIETYGHPGGGWGYSSALFYSPALDVSVSVLANTKRTDSPTTRDGAPRSSCATQIDFSIDPLACIARGIFETLAASP